jgi:hypothetical protein
MECIQDWQETFPWNVINAVDTLGYETVHYQLGNAIHHLTLYNGLV